MIVPVIFFTACGSDHNDPGLEYAPNMYHSEAYEPLKQVMDTNTRHYNNYNPYNNSGMSMRKPPEHTVKMQDFSFKYDDEEQQELYIYHIPADSFDLAGRVLKNPIPKTEEALAKGKVLYETYCDHCHGEKGQAGGKVAEVYAGVPPYNSRQLANRKAGHIYHAITYGRNLMWPHASQISPKERWYIVHYVQKLQKQ